MVPLVTSKLTSVASMEDASTEPLVVRVLIVGALSAAKWWLPLPVSSSIV